MNKSPNPGFKAILPWLRKHQKQMTSHAVFAAVLLVLLAYVFMVWRIGQLATANPGPDQLSSSSSGQTPTVDKSAIDQIQKLEQSNTNVHALFDNARNNPFQE
ncbi:MAG TPA: hypothetical protein VEH48_02460 [Candidatus Nitrosopolaris sp.]|nr:hypothetical protein [Candidatus Nitrosopolaris sp.]